MGVVEQAGFSRQPIEVVPLRLELADGTRRVTAIYSLTPWRPGNAPLPVVAVTVQNSVGVQGFYVLEPRAVFEQIESVATDIVNVAQNALVSGRDASRWGNAHANLVPYQLFRARDRHVVIAVGSDAQWAA